MEPENDHGNYTTILCDENQTEAGRIRTIKLNRPERRMRSPPR